MKLNPKYLAQHYASLSDEALLQEKRSDLTELAQTYYDDEVKRRGLTPGARKPRADRKAQPSPSDEEPNQYGASDGEKPAWLDDAAEVFSAHVRRGVEADAGVSAEMARRALEAADIPCYLELRDIPNDDDSSGSELQQEWRLLVPGELNMQAASILDRDLFNEEFEANWKAHIEALSDEQLLAMTPEVVFCGLFDRIERVTRAYEEELARRGIEEQ